MKNVEDVYALSPMQQGMLFHTLYDPGSGVYVEQVSCTIQGNLDVPAFQRAWQQVIDRHPILRTAFLWEGLEAPVQVVRRRVRLPWEALDWRGLVPADQEQRLEELLRADQAREFDLSAAPLMRLTLIRVGEQVYHFVWSHHHILLDGWSTPLVQNEVFVHYAAFAQGREAHVERSRPFRDYIAWLRRQDLAKAEAFWRQFLRGFTAPTRLVVDHAARDSSGAAGYAEQQLRLADPMVAALQALARQHGLTVNTLVQGAWALLLSRYSGEEDVVFGVTVSGRPPDLPGSDAMIGLFINTLPMRVRLPPEIPALAWLKQTQVQQAQLRQYEYSPLVQVQGWSAVPRGMPLFESIVVFENYPTMTGGAGPEGSDSSSLAVQDMRSMEQTNYSLTLLAGSSLALQLTYDCRRFDDSTITRILGHLRALLEGIAAHSARRLAELPLLTAAERRQILVEWNATQTEFRSQESGVRRARADGRLLTSDAWCLQDMFEAQVARTPDSVAVMFDRPTTRGQGSGVRETRRQGDKETRRQESGVRSQESEFLAPNLLLPPAGGGTSAPLPPPAGGGTEGGRAWTSAALSPQSSVLSPEQLTYRELNTRADQLAHYLRSLGVGPDVPVAIGMQRSIELVVGLLGILKAGGAYVPLDPAYPAARLAFMLEDARAPVLITTNDQRPTTNDGEPRTKNQEPGMADEPITQNSKLKTQNYPHPFTPSPLHPFTPSGSVVDLRADWDSIARERAEPRRSAVTADNLAYVIYTSGSTGTPKGAMNSHRAIVNRLCWMQDAYGLDGDDVVLQKTPISFDVSVWEFFWPLLAGARLILARPGGHQDSAYLARLIAAERVTTLHFVPSMLHVFLDEPDLARCDRLRRVICSGEALPVELHDRFFARLSAELHNLYGPTEAAVDVTAWWCARAPGQRSVPIGRPIANIQIYLLDRHMRPAPIGVAGELYIGGAGLARGYLNRPDLTAERFVPNPFGGVLGDGCWVLEDSAPNTQHPTPNTRLYKTGDLARYRADGAIEYLGRIDAQVKIRGVRIELGEIEAVLLQHPAVREAVVLAREDAPGEKRLVAYVVPKIEDRGLKIEDSGSDAPDPLSSILYPLSSELRTFLQTRLPETMVPALFVVLPALPLTPNGKLDRRALPAPDQTGLALGNDQTAPRTPEEDLLVGIWAEVLRQARVGVHDDFFALGGHSLLATQVISRVREIFQVELPLRSLFEAPTAAQFAGHVAHARRNTLGIQAPPLQPVPRDGALPLSFAQRRLWVIEQLEPSAAYNIPVAVRLTGALDLTVLRRSLSAITQRHEILRTTFALVDGQPVQLIGPARPAALSLIDLRGTPEGRRDAAARALVAAEMQRPFDLACGPLFRAALLRLRDDDHVIMLTLHHIVTDAWSMDILVRELGALYSAFATSQPSPLPELPVQYADYAVWQRNWLQGSGVRGQGPGDKETRRQGDKETRSREHALPHPPSQPAPCATLVPHPSPPPALRLSPIQAQLAYWRQQLAGLATLDLPTDHPRPPVETFQGASEGFALPEPLSAQLLSLSRREAVTPFMTLLAAFQLLLGRYSGQDDVAVGTPIANRTRAETEGLIGFFLNTLVLRADLSGAPTFLELLRRVREVCLGAYAHQDLPFEQIVDALQPARDLARHPLFQVMFTFQNAARTELALPDVALRPMEIARTTTQFDLMLSVEETRVGLAGVLEYRTDLFEAATITRMSEHFQVLLAGIAARPEQRVAELPIMSDVERRQVLVEWNAPRPGVRSQESGVRSASSDSWCLHRLFEVQVARTPDAVAVVFDGRTTNDERPTTNDHRPPTTDHRSPLHPFTPSPLHPFSQHLTYHELNERANRLAHHLRALGVGPEVRVGICLERSLELVITLLGVLKAGGAYVPLDPAYPQERLAFMLADSQAAVLITTTDHRPPTTDHRPPLHPFTPSPLHPFTPSPPHLVTLSESWPAIARCAADDPIGALDPANLAYVIYTSGSTGTPKGAMNTHRAVANRLRWMWETYNIAADDRILQKTPFSFDVSVWELFCPLMVGAALVLARPGGHQDSIYLAGLIATERITMLHFVPTMLQVFLEEPDLPRSDSLRRVICSGEALSVELQDRCFARLNAEVHNLYGPTEAAVDVTAWACERAPRQRSVPIGRPIANIQIYLLDRQAWPVPIGIPGELHIGGVGLARGYLGRPDLTAERFIPNPFAGVTGDGCWVSEDPAPNTQHPTPNTRLYRTGDLARYRPDGVIEYLGRIDTQVKIRGFRIELGEVETMLRQHPAVRETVVVVREDAPGDRRLVAYVVPKIEDRGLKIEDSGSSAPEPLSSILYPLSSELRGFLQSRLPDYMVPSAFVTLDALPLTPSGKVDRRALPAPGSARPALDDAFVAPRTPVEATLARIWAEVLRLDRVGIHDNFFALGGDSILSIQIIAKARQADIYLMPRQLFQHQTIADLAVVAGTAPTSIAEQGLVKGPLPLTPIQRWFFEQGQPDPQHFNQSLLLAVRQPLDPALLEQTIQHLLRHHDALRLCFTRDEASWRQHNAGIAPLSVVAQVDLSELPAGERGPAIETLAGEVQASLDLGRGPLIRVALFDCGADQPQRLLLVIHHLAVDGVSWRVLLEDLQTAYTQLNQGAAVALPPKTTSFKQWAERLQTYARSDELRSELPYWLAPQRRGAGRMPLDEPAGANTVASARSIMTALDADDTNALLHEVPAVYHTQINDVLLTALAQVLAAWSGTPALLVDLEGHGREELFDDVDLSRTVGWYTSLFPVLLNLEQVAAPGAALKAVKEQLRAVPRRGIGYGILRYLSADVEVSAALRAQPPAEVMFNYLGQVDQALPAEGPFNPAPESSGPEQSPRGRRSHPLEISTIVAGGQLRMVWTYSAELHRHATIERLAQSYLASLRALIAHCRSPEAGGYTPSDFPLARLDQPTLDRLVGADRQIEAIYPLVPMQQGMLFHSLYEPQAGMYIEQLAVTLHGDVDISAFQRAWQSVVERHAIFRTAMAWEALETPLQIVRQSVRLPWEMSDWRAIAPDEQEAKLTACLRADRARGFVLSQAPLMRLALFQLAEEAYSFVWSYHHMLLDGWSMSLVIGEVFANYAAFAQGQEIKLAAPRPYRDYVAWLQRQDLGAAEVFWRQMLAGVAAPTSLGVDRAVASASRAAGYVERRAYLPSAATGALEALARRQRLTLNTLLQGAWALLLSHYSGEEDVVFGATVSGRPPELPGSDAMIGLFINTLPVRVRVPPDALAPPWLQQLQAQQAEVRQYEYSPLVQVQGWSAVPRSLPMFESIVIFENYPVTEAVQEQGGQPSVGIGSVRTVEQTNYPLTLVAAQGQELEIIISYDCDRFDAATVERIFGHIQTVLEGLAEQPDRRLADLPLLTAAERRQLLVEWNATAAEFPHDRCLHQLFAAQATRTPDAVAVVFDRPPTTDHRPPTTPSPLHPFTPSPLHPFTQHLAYRELNERANRLAHHLRSLGVGPEVRVGLCLERSVELIVGLLGILVAGGAYVPLDPTYPAERLAFMLEDAQVAVLITTTDQRPTTNDHPFTPSPLHPFTLSQRAVVCLDANWPAIARCAADDPVGALDPANLVYVIYTSGSTGAPKGVMAHHRGLVNFTYVMADWIGLGPAQRFLQFASFSFDASTVQVFPTLISGATLVLHPDPARLSNYELLELCARQQISILDLPAAFWQQWVADLAARQVHLPASVRVCMTGGESITQDRLRTWAMLADRPVLFLSSYGPTEATVTTTLFDTTSDAVDRLASPTAPLGRLMPNAQIYLLDRRLQPVPIGIPGEVYIGGAGVVRGYLHRPELTAERFIPNPIAGVTGDRCWVLEDATPNTQHPSPNTRLYRTGDLARYRSDGSVEFLGRLDQQVKLRGFRVELGEVEAALLQHPAVHECVTLVREDAPGDRRLVAYVVPKIEDRGLKIEDSGSSAPDPLSSILYPLSSELRAFLQTKLPDYMLPSAFVALEALPLTPHGKVDHRALPAPDQDASALRQSSVMPRDALELQLVRIWETVLGVSPIGVTDNFFDLGGHSLLAVGLMAHVQQQFGYDLPLAVLLQEPTIEQFATLLRRRSGPLPWSPLVTLKASGSRPPLFCIHPAGGNVHSYMGLARLLDPDRPVYGLQSRGLEGDLEPYERVEDMAAHYLEALRAVQPQGPYYLCGWSLGGAVAFEIAQQLHRQDQEVALLAVLDTGAPQLGDYEPPSDADLLVNIIRKENLPLPYEEFVQLAPDELIDMTLALAKRHRMMPPDTDPHQLRRLMRIFKLNMVAMSRYVPQVYPGQIMLFKAMEDDDQDATEAVPETARADPTLGWDALSTQPVVIHPIPGSHMTMMAEPQLRVLVERLRACLDAPAEEG